MPVLENLVSSTQLRGIVVELCPCPKLQMPDARLVIGIFSDEEHAFFKEGLLLKLWPLGERLKLHWLKVFAVGLEGRQLLQTLG